jgi:hypothetical protein
LKRYITNLRACPHGTPVTPEFVIGACYRLVQMEKSFRMAKSDLQAPRSTTAPAARSKPT